MFDKQVTVTQQNCQNEIIYCEKHKPSSCDIVMGDNSNSTFISNFRGKIKRHPVHLYFALISVVIAIMAVINLKAFICWLECLY